MDFAREYITRVEAMSGGRVTIDLQPAGAIVGAFQVMDGVHDGVIDAAHTVPVYWYGKHKGASLFGTGPVWGGDAANLLSWFYAGGGRDFYRELVQDILGLNVVGFFAFPMPAQPLGWFKNPVASAEEMKGLKYRTVGLAADLMQQMGAKVTQLPGGEIVPAMERGVIDAFEYNNPTSDLRFGAQDVAKNYMLGSYHQAMEFFEILINKKKWDALPKDLQAIWQYGVEAANSANFWTAMHNYSNDLQELINKHKVNVVRTPRSVFEDQLKAWDAVSKKLQDEDPVFKKVVDSQLAWAKRVAYYMFLNEADYRLGYEHVFKTKLPA
jgi:TRAP-type mannitol/chloroaromatic compound transport system substrate-binding protein